MSGNLYMDINRIPNEAKILNENNFLLVDHILEKGTFFHLHFHDYFEIEIILSGKVEYICNKRNYIAVQGFACLMSPNDLHSLKFLEDTRIINIRFTEKIINEELRYISSASTSIYTKHELELFLKTIQEISNEQSKNLQYSKILISNKLSEIMINIIRKNETGTRTETTLTDSVHKAIIYINNNFKKDINLLSCAKALSLSSDHLSRLIKNATGTTFTQYLNMTRMKYATTLLLTTKLSVKEVAANCGYNSTEYFLYKFKNTFSTTPQNYRNNFISGK